MTAIHRFACGVALAIVLAVSVAASSGPLGDATQGLGDRLKNKLKATVPPVPKPAPATPSAPTPAPTPSPGTATAPTPAPTPAAAASAVQPEPMSDDEKVYVAPQATTKIADTPRKANLNPKVGSKFSPGVAQGEVTITNPFMDPSTMLFVKAAALSCTADGGLIIGGEAGLNPRQQALGIGYWRIAPDGAVTPIPLLTRSARAYAKTHGAKCDTRYGKTVLTPENSAMAPDGSIIKTTEYAVERIRTDGFVERLAGAPFACEEDGNPSKVKGFVDGPADVARFDKLGPPAVDPQGNVWVADQDECTLRRISPDGMVTTVIPSAKICDPSIAREGRLGLQNLTWDAAHGELVSARTFTVAEPVHNLNTMVWRIKPNGEFRRVLFGKKVSVSPSKVHLDGVWSMAVDPAGRIFIASRFMEISGTLMVLRVDEAAATAVAVTGGGFKLNDSYESAPRDGAAARAHFNHLEGMCFSPDGTLFMLDEHLVKKLDKAGQVSTWAF